MEQIVYQGSSIYDAALKGDFPLVVLIWGMAAAQRVSPFAVDVNQNSAVHYAAVGGNVEILHFFAQQAALVGPDSTTIIDAPNNTGETPLIRAAHVGNVLAVKVLVDLGCNLLHQDCNGNTAAHHAAHEGHLWTLHYLLEAQVDLDVVAGGQCLMQRDVLQWACDGGKTQIIDYLLERGHDPNIPDIEGRTALHHAILDGDKPLVKKLLAHGAKADTSDDRGLTALSTANNLRRNTIVNMLLAPISRSTASKSLSKPRRTRIHVMLLYAVLWLGCLILCVWAPWYIFFPGLFLALYLSMRTMAHRNHKHGKKAHSKQTFPPQVALTLIRQTRGSVFEIQENQEELLRHIQPEKPPSCPSRAWTWFKSQPEVAIGLWFGWLAGFSLCLGYRIYVDAESSVTFGFWTDNAVLVIALLSMEFICLVIWMCLICGDSGRVDTSALDFPKMLDRAATGFAPSDQSHCSTCLVTKPLRSKHCAQCGICVGRMDHHCIWINTCVGFGNQRLFVVFLALHLIVVALYLALFLLYVSARHTYLEILLKDSLPEVVVIFWAIMTCIFLGKLLVDQLGGIARNLTLNEKINWKRYAYLNSKGTTISNPFDHGWRANFAEFAMQSVDYMSLFTVPTAKESIKEP
ncbi:hypothetical protein LEN26_013433 [Aphanomyces euteiches]|nr:hypothetical protein LEN26_013433 [Aphanomyces euteiches]KAH9116964.1 hypothetical protein AeMF1_009171 [Aphanomyces euteiches]KAH9195847.1 hypothetical protein AeNC1_002195 [Aphanomyces euteiches]